MDLTIPEIPPNRSFFGRSRIFLGLVLFGLFALGAGIRLFDLTDQPLDFHPTRQLRSAIIARSLYYRELESAPEWQQARAAQQLAGYGLIEPLVFESTVALVYRVIGSDPVWVARLFAILFWMVGGAALYLLASEMTTPDGGVISLAYYLFLPFGIIASRSFQPDPLMVMLLLLALWRVYRWYRSPSWKTAILAGLLLGLAMFVKAVALFLLLPAVAALILASPGLRQAVRDPQVWAMAALAALPVIAYHIYGVYILGTMESQFEGRFFPQLWTDPSFYMRWFGQASGYAGYGAVLAALLGPFLLTTPARRALGFGLWAGYFLLGMTFSYHITTHSYYHLPLIPVVALSLAPLAALALGPLVEIRPVWLVRAAVLGLLLAGAAGKAWEARLELAERDYRDEPAYWTEISEQLGVNSSVVGLTHDYGNRLAYYGWITPAVWLPSGHLENYRELRGGSPLVVQEWFAEITGDKDYFLVTLVNQLNRQPELNDLLYENFKVKAEGDGYVIFDLRDPIQ
jgi:hypothetical protein